MAIHNISSMKEFNEKVMNSDSLAVVDFWAPWCGPCKAFGPVFEELAKERDDVMFVKVNIDEAEDIAVKFSIMAIPTILTVKDGEVIDQRSGALTKDQLNDFLDSSK